MKGFLSNSFETDSIRIGMIVPSSNVTMEKEVPRILHRRELTFPEKFSFHSSRVSMKRVDPESLLAMNQHADRAALELADASVDVMLYACLVAIMVQRPGAHREIEKQLENTIRNANAFVPVITSAGALVNTLLEINAGKIALIAPYMPPLTAKVCQYLENEGVEVVSAQSLSVADNCAVGRLNPANLLDLLDNIPPSAEAIVLSACVQMPSLDMIAEAERITGLPVVTAAAATVYQALKTLGLKPGIQRFGSLLKGAVIIESSLAA